MLVVMSMCRFSSPDLGFIYHKWIDFWCQQFVESLWSYLSRSHFSFQWMKSTCNVKCKEEKRLPRLTNFKIFVTLVKSRDLFVFETFYFYFIDRSSALIQIRTNVTMSINYWCVWSTSSRILILSVCSLSSVI